MANYNVIILGNNDSRSFFKWEKACILLDLNFIKLNLLSNNWENIVRNYNPDFCLAKPPGDILKDKLVYDDRIQIIEKELEVPIYPGYNEIFIYENKSNLAKFLKKNRIPHPNTYLSSDFDETIDFCKNVELPIVAKTIIGAAGSGVTILKKRAELLKYIEKVFKSGVSRRFGPNRKTGNIWKWISKSIVSPKYLISKLKEYTRRHKDVQKNFIILQEFINHDYEWRLVKIGDSFFGYKKLKIDSMASGSKEFDYGPVPFNLLNFLRETCESYKFNFMAIDVFLKDEKILVNEMQTIFGHKNTYICKPDVYPGRYLYKNNHWIFEKGDFNTNESYNLRLATAIELYENSRRL